MKSFARSVAVGAAIVASIVGIAFARNSSLGSADARRRFVRRNRAFLRRLPRLRSLIRMAMDRELPTAGSPRVIFLLLRRIADDFEEILTLAHNGHGFGALSLLRGMYERIVTAYHLHNNPDDTDNYLDYHWVQRRKLANVIGETPETPLSPDRRAELEANFNAVKKRYETVLCRHCGYKDVNFRWHKLDLVNMAKKTKVQAIRDLLVRAYYIPLEHAHGTAGSLLYQVKGQDGVAVIRSNQDTMWADHAVATAHLLVLLAVAVLRLHIKLDALQPEIDGCAVDHQSAWPNIEASAA